MEKVNIKLKSTVKAKGRHVINICDMRSKEAQDIEAHILKIDEKRKELINRGDEKMASYMLDRLSQEFHASIKELNDKFRVRRYCVENITTTVGRQVAAQLLAGTYGSTGAVTHTAVGDDATGAVVGDTILGNETSRKAISDTNTNGAQTLLETFFATAEAVDTHEEFGMFIDGTGAADSGVLFNRFTQTVVKSNTESMNVQTTVDWNDA